MPYAQIDVDAMDHWKIGGLSDAAFRLWVAGLCYAQKHLTDGHLDRRAIKMLRAVSTPDVVAELVDNGLWHEHDTGYTVHDFVAWNKSRDEVDAIRSKWRKDKARKRGGISVESTTESTVESTTESTEIPLIDTIRYATIRNAAIREERAGARETRPAPAPDAPCTDDLWQGWRSACQRIGVTEFAQMNTRYYPQAKQLLDMGTVAEWGAAFDVFLASPEFHGKRSWAMFLANAPQVLGHVRAGNATPFGTAPQPTMGIRGSKTQGNAAAAAQVIAAIRAKAAQGAA